MSDLPTGTVTFLFTDIEGSTRLLQQLGDKYASLLMDHEKLMREACESHQGHIVDVQGDGFFMAFPSALDAIHAAVYAQRALTDHNWPDGVNLRVRMGLHTGEPQINALGYMGIDVHRAARIGAVGYGGQVLVSQTTHDLVASELPEDVTFRDLGEHRLKDLRQPKRLYQLVITGLPFDFPPLKSLALASNNLPIQLTSFIGREKEIADVRQLIGEHRLVTLTGPGGSGKTRLAVQVATELVEQFENGVCFVALAPITDPGLVASTIAQSIGVSEVAGRSLIDNLKDHLRNKTILLLLDNFEQVIPAAPLVADLLKAGSGVKILSTSRESLRVSGEREYFVPPLSVPNLTQLPSVESLSQYAAIELFRERAQAVKPDFVITTDTAPAIAEICYRLDGLPLAIELAAARIKMFSPRTMLARLENRLAFLTGGARELPARQQTLRNAIAWSYDLLEESEQALFRRVSVFVGGCTLDAVEAICADPQAYPSLLDHFGSLLDKSLLREVEGISDEPRFIMLELLREFGLEQLKASGEQDDVQVRHANFFLALAEQAESKLEGVDQREWIQRVEQEHDNLRAALEWSETAESAGELCLRLAGALGMFWETRGYFSEGRERLSDVLATPSAQGGTLARAKLLARASELAYRQSDYAATVELAEESLNLYRSLGDKQGIAASLIKLGNAATEAGDYEMAVGFLEEALSIWQELDDKHGTARALISLGWAALRPGDYPLANTRLEAALAISRQLEDTRSIGFELSGLGEVALRQGDYGRARQLLEESLDLRRQLGNKWGVGVSLGTLGWVALQEGDWSRALTHLGESLKLRQEIGDKGGSAWCIERLAEVALAQGDSEKAVRLLSAAAALRISIGSVIDPADQPEYQKRRAALREDLGSQKFASLWEEGRTLTLEQAALYALKTPDR